MGKRRDGREAAVQYLYQIDLGGEKPANAENFWRLRSGPGKAPVPPKTRTFAEELVQGVLTHLEEIDGYIKKYTANYEIERLAAVDRNILRLATYELLHSLDVAPVVIIDEAIEIAKRYGSDKSGGFVNGILDRIKGEVGRPAREPVSPAKS